MDYSKIIPRPTHYMQYHTAALCSLAGGDRKVRFRSHCHKSLLLVKAMYIQHINIMHNTLHLRCPPLRNDLSLLSTRGCCPDHTRQLLAYCKGHGESPMQPRLPAEC